MLNSLSSPVLRRASNRALSPLSLVLGVLCLSLLPLVSPSAPVRSNIGGDGEEYGESPESTAVLYVQDGLIAMWDGIENAGWGVHDAAATVWKDLSGNGHDIILSGNFKWMDDHCSINGRNNGVAICSGFSASTPTTQEMVVLVRSCDSYGRYIGENCGLITGGTSKPFGWQYAFGTDGPWEDGSVGFNEITSVSAIFADRGLGYFNSVLKANYARSYLNRSYPTTIRLLNRPAGGKGIDGNVYCFRIYSRALTEEEIRYNYSIDQMRFGL